MGFYNSSYADGLKYGLTYSISVTISRSAGLHPVSLDLNDSFFLSHFCMLASKYSMESSSLAKLKSVSSFKLGNLSRILTIWSLQLLLFPLAGEIGKHYLPLNRYLGFFMKANRKSRRTQPRAQTSAALPYCLWRVITSGAR